MGAMQRSKVGTVTVQAFNAATNRDIGPFYTAGAVPVRLYIRNRGGVQLQLAFESNAVNGASANQSSADRFELDEAEDITLFLAPGQSVFAVGMGQGRLSWHAANVPYVDLGGEAPDPGNPSTSARACPPAGA